MDIGVQDRLVTTNLLKEILQIDMEVNPFNGLGDIHASYNDNLLTYIKDDNYIDVIINNSCISGVICTKSTASILPREITKVVHEDPNYAFFSLVNYFGKKAYSNFSSEILSPTNTSGVSISSYGVIIGKNVFIEPNVTILSGVRIDDDVIIRAGSVIGLDTFQHQKTSKGIISPKHDGILHIKSGVEIGANSTISRGFSYRNTVIGRNCKLDAQVYIAHGTHIGNNVIICAGARIMGHVEVDDEAFIGPSSTISSRVKLGTNSRTSIGSVVTKDVLPNQTVSGNFAIPHDKFIRNMKKVVI
ncbi:MAG: UDP-3-O-[3-hydroxymyristoyl] glucosamine N-acyltransferase [Colwellia sp.]